MSKELMKLEKVKDLLHDYYSRFCMFKGESLRFVEYIELLSKTIATLETMKVSVSEINISIYDEKIDRIINDVKYLRGKLLNVLSGLIYSSINYDNNQLNYWQEEMKKPRNYENKDDGLYFSSAKRKYESILKIKNFFKEVNIDKFDEELLESYKKGSISFEKICKQLQSLIFDYIAYRRVYEDFARQSKFYPLSSNIVESFKYSKLNGANGFKEVCNAIWSLQDDIEKENRDIFYADFDTIDPKTKNIFGLFEKIYGDNEEIIKIAALAHENYCKERYWKFFWNLTDTIKYGNDGQELRNAQYKDELTTVKYSCDIPFMMWHPITFELCVRDNDYQHFQEIFYDHDNITLREYAPRFLTKEEIENARRDNLNNYVDGQENILRPFDELSSNSKYHICAIVDCTLSYCKYLVEYRGYSTDWIEQHQIDVLESVYKKVLSMNHIDIKAKKFKDVPSSERQLYFSALDIVMKYLNLEYVLNKKVVNLRKVPKSL